MEVRDAYAQWARQYDTNKNHTRDMEGRVLREMLAERKFRNILEIGCGTGKNTVFLAQIADELTAVDLTEEMIDLARQKVTAEHVTFLQADILDDWNFGGKTFDLITFSLVLEHIENLGEIFRKAARVTHTGSLLYVGELHPFKQYTGTKARFETEHGLTEVTCFVHHVSEFVKAASAVGFTLLKIEEHFDEHLQGIPRILALLFQKM